RIRGQPSRFQRIRLAAVWFDLGRRGSDLSSPTLLVVLGSSTTCSFRRLAAWLRVAVESDSCLLLFASADDVTGKPHEELELTLMKLNADQTSRAEVLIMVNK
ncbi:hypothetical protein Tsubulata_029361, partial [Turnera subulata]